MVDGLTRRRADLCCADADCRFLPYFLLALPIAGLMSPWILLVVDRNVPLVLFDPLTPDTVHASLLIFPELAKLANSLSRWVSNDLA